MFTDKTNFQVITRDINCRARTGVLTTPHGDVETPVFCPVGTSGTVKGIMPAQLKETGCTLILANTYHLMLRPGAETIEKLGGLHNFMAWDSPILTDSGGYQVFSLSPLTKITDKGVQFASHIDGSKIMLTPSLAIEIQNKLGADIIMCLDQCTSFPCEHKQLQKAVTRTISWAEQCQEFHKNPNQMLFAIVQGGIEPDLRKECASELVRLDFDGYAIGGLGLGEGHDNMIKTLSMTNELLPKDKPRYLMGVGTPADIIAAVREGVDIFDCVLPTRNGRNAFAFTDNGPVRLRNRIHTNDNSPIEVECDCYCCQHFSRAALRHFFHVSEMLGPILVSIHNLRFYQRLMAKIRLHVKNGVFYEWSQQQSEYLKFYNSNNGIIKK